MCHVQYPGRYKASGEGESATDDEVSNGYYTQLEMDGDSTNTVFKECPRYTGFIVKEGSSAGESEDYKVNGHNLRT